MKHKVVKRPDWLRHDPPVPADDFVCLVLRDMQDVKRRCKPSESAEFDDDAAFELIHYFTTLDVSGDTMAHRLRE
jgi:hypothetical protein